ncbi:class I SAM-dependent methyltransferase [Sinorhizobium meliloti]|nr:class I SAM-dependent methyltransferase [Sinorhizobium meliloti]
MGGYGMSWRRKWPEQGINRHSGNIYKYILIYILKYKSNIEYVNNITSAISPASAYISRYIILNTLLISECFIRYLLYARRQGCHSVRRTDATLDGTENKEKVMNDHGQVKDAYSAYGEIWSDVYDEYAQVLNKAVEIDRAVSFLAPFTSDGTALELGVGNGHIALPLSGRGASVHGLDNSEKMLASLSAKGGGDAITTHLGDMAQFDLGMQFDLVYCINNSFSHMVTVEQQLGCLASIEKSLRPNGRFVIHLNYPYTADFSGSGIYGDQRTTVMHVDERRAMVRFARHDRNQQLFISQDLWITPAGTRTMPLKMRYFYPTELDLLARFSGLELLERHGDWQKRPFDNASWRYMSVFRKAT